MHGFHQQYLPNLLWLLLIVTQSWSVRAQGKSEDGFMQAVTAKFFM
jgi:hypothetical protein